MTKYNHNNRRAEANGNAFLYNHDSAVLSLGQCRSEDYHLSQRR